MVTIFKTQVQSLGCCFFKCVLLSCAEKTELEPLDDVLRNKHLLSLLCCILYVKTFLLAKGPFRGEYAQ